MCFLFFYKCVIYLSNPPWGWDMLYKPPHITNTIFCNNIFTLDKQEKIYYNQKKECRMSRIHIISRGKNWAIKREENSRATKIYKLKNSAIKYAVEITGIGEDFIVHKQDGSVDWIGNIGEKKGV